MDPPILSEQQPWFRGQIGLMKDMTETEKAVLETLVQLEAAVGSMASANPKPDLQSFFVRLDQLTAQLPRGTDPNLLHYLHKKSYQKARLFLEGRQAENQEGNCHHV